MDSLPPECIAHIAGFTDPLTVCRISRVSRNLYRSIDKNYKYLPQPSFHLNLVGDAHGFTHCVADPLNFEGYREIFRFNGYADILRFAKYAICSAVTIRVHGKASFWAIGSLIRSVIENLRATEYYFYWEYREKMKFKCKFQPDGIDELIQLKKVSVWMQPELYGIMPVPAVSDVFIEDVQFSLLRQVFEAEKLDSTVICDIPETSQNVYFTFQRFFAWLDTVERVSNGRVLFRTTESKQMVWNRFWILVHSLRHYELKEPQRRKCYYHVFMLTVKHHLEHFYVRIDLSKFDDSTIEIFNRKQVDG